MGQLYSRRREMSFRDMILFCSLERVLSVPVNCCRLRRKAIGWGLAPAVLNLCWLSVGNNNIILNCSADKYKSSLCQCRVQNLQSRDHEVFRLTVAETVIECHRVIERLLLVLSRISIRWRPEEGIQWFSLIEVKLRLIRNAIFECPWQAEIKHSQVLKMGIIVSPIHRDWRSSSSGGDMGLSERTCTGRVGKYYLQMYLLVK